MKDKTETSASSAAPVAPCPACGSLSNEPGWTVCRSCNTPRPERPGSREQAPSADFSEAEKPFSIALQTALADGVITRQEKAFLLDTGKKLGLPESYLDIVMKSLTPFMEPDEPVKHERKMPFSKNAIDSEASPDAQSENTAHSAPQKDPNPVEETPVRPDRPEDMSALTHALMDKSHTRESVLNAAKPLLRAGVSPKTLSRHVILTLGAAVKDDSDCYVAPLFDIKKLKKAPFALPAVLDGQKQLFYFDNTMFGKGDEGFLLTDDTFYSSTTSMNVLPYASITSTALNKKKLFINGVPIEASESKDNLPTFYFMLTVLSELWKDSKERQYTGLTNVHPKTLRKFLRLLSSYTDSRDPYEQKKKLREFRILLNSYTDSRDPYAFTGYVRRMLALRSDRDQLCREVILYVGKKIKDDFDIYVVPSFKMSRLCKAPFVTRAVQADEELLLYFSAYGNEGFLLTNKALYSSNKLLGRVPYYAIDFVVGDMKNCSIKILRQELPMKHVSDERFKTLQYLFELISIIQKVTPLQS
ncbi:hypothetical protein [uncultured Mailhella sp.]|uniref:hypothetical protein n=1 Tax=uncultured Mailhella sp. TaxID=1981031 RepID=UPI0025D242C9|nr:hypothetical protein [uncultured Mailhella sp.]